MDPEADRRRRRRAVP